MERVSAYAEGVRHERAMSESAAHGESTWTRKRTTAEGLMGRFWTFYSKVAQACGVCNLRERIAPLRRLSGSLSALILREPTTIPCTPPHSFCVLSDCPSPSVSACWGARALAGCTQQALTKLKNVLPNDLGTEKTRKTPRKWCGMRRELGRACTQ